MTVQNQKVSVIVPVYNAADFLEETILSVINQTHDNWELILVDDGSQDQSLEIINRYKDDRKIFLLQHPGEVNLGVSKTRELGIDFATGKYIAFLDADDVFYENKLFNQLSLFSKYEDIILAHSKVELINDTDIYFNNEFKYFNNDKSYKYDEQQNWLKSNKICNSTVVVKAEFIKGLHFGLPQLFQYEDWLLWSLLAKKGKFYYQDEPLIKYRVHPASATSAVLKNRLVSPYSKIEYLLSFYLLNNNAVYSKIIISRINEELIQLMRIYSNGNFSKVDSFGLELYDSESKDISILEKYNSLLNDHRKLQKDLKEERSKISSRLFRFLKRLKVII